METKTNFRQMLNESPEMQKIKQSEKMEYQRKKSIQRIKWIEN